MLAADAVQVVVKVVSPYIGDTLAHSAAEAHFRRLGVSGGSITPDQLETVLDKLGSGLDIFLGRAKSAAVMADVRRELAQALRQ